MGLIMPSWSVPCSLGLVPGLQAQTSEQRVVAVNVSNTLCLGFMVYLVVDGVRGVTVLV